MKKIETLISDLQQRGVNDETLNGMLGRRNSLLNKYNQFKDGKEEKQKQSATMLRASLDKIEVEVRAKIKELLKANSTDEEKAKFAENLAKMNAGRLKKQGKSPEYDSNDDYFHKERWKFGI